MQSVLVLNDVDKRADLHCAAQPMLTAPRPRERSQHPGSLSDSLAKVTALGTHHSERVIKWGCPL